MAVARMLRVTVIGYRPVMDDVVGRLQRANVLDIVTEESDVVPTEEIHPDDPRLRRLEEMLADVQFVREFLGRYHKSEAKFSAFVSEKIHLSSDEFERVAADEEFVTLYRRCVEIADRLATIERERDRLAKLVDELRPWTPLHTQLSSLRGTRRTVLFTGTVPASAGPRIRERLRESVREVTVEELDVVAPRQAWVVIAHRSCLAEVRSVLASTDFAEVAFPGLNDTPAEELAVAEERIAELDREEVALEESAAALSKERYHSAVVLAEALESQLHALIVRERFGATERAFVVRGWVRERSRDEIEAALEPLDGDVDVTFAEPTPEDSPPVELENKRFIRPFEVLTDLYGRPRYGELDPTPLLAPFFLMFFALCIEDVGYGAMLIAGSWFIKNKIDVAPGVKKFMDLLMVGGAGAMVAGVLFGSWFALPADVLPAPLLALKVMDPLEELTQFLVLTVVLGVLQVFFGVFVAAYDAFRRGDAATAIAEQLSIVFLFVMIGVAAAVPGAARWAIVIGLGVTIILQGRALSAARQAEWATPAEEREEPSGEESAAEEARRERDRVRAQRPALAVWDSRLALAWLVLLVGWLVSLAFQGPAVVGWVLLGATVLGLVFSRGIRRSVVALLGGAYAVYGMSSFIGDILSYTRLAALGLSGALVGMVFNLLAGLVMGPATGLIEGGGIGIVFGVVVGVLAAAVFVVGHTFNVVINLLGAFVHPARLQFVEFFSKFYEGGGRKYSPFGFVTKATMLHAGRVRQEGVDA